MENDAGNIAFKSDAQRAPEAAFERVLPFLTLSAPPFLKRLGGLSMLASLATGLLCGCGLPTSGPRGEAVERLAAEHVTERDPDRLPYCLVDVDPRVTDVVKRAQYRLAGRFADQRPPARVEIGTGDVISISLYEAASGGLFFPIEGGLRNANNLILPNQIVDESGNITVPYAGTIRARGRTVRGIQKAIVDGLKRRAIEPQALVTVVERRNAMISVFGEVNQAVRFPASLSGERILDAIARAGGLKSQGHETWVLLKRGANIAVAPFESLVYEPANNVYVNPQDTIYLFKEPQTYLAFGATGRQGQVPFDSWRLSMAEGLARAGGLIDERAEPGWAFLFRAERRETATTIDRACDVVAGPYIPVIYKFNLRDPSAMFLATRFPMRNKDVLYVANARTVEMAKLMNYVRLVNATVHEPIQTALTTATLVNTIKGNVTAPIIALP
ncbi:MAG: polysaccharide biosynthesis/export family protein [Hyphomicrobiaceae bacterium]